MEIVKDMANQMLEELGKGILSGYPSLERQLEIINNLCEKCKNPYTCRVGSLTSRQVIASTIVQYFASKINDPILKESQGKPSPITRR